MASLAPGLYFFKSSSAAITKQTKQTSSLAAISKLYCFLLIIANLVHIMKITQDYFINKVQNARIN